MGNKGILIGTIIAGIAVMLALSSIPAYAHHPGESFELGDCKPPNIDKGNVVITTTPTKTSPGSDLDRFDGNANGWICLTAIINLGGTHFVFHDDVRT